MPDGWIKKNTNVFGGRTVMELKGLSCISLETYQEKKKIVVYQGRLEEKLQN